MPVRVGAARQGQSVGRVDAASVRCCKIAALGVAELPLWRAKCLFGAQKR
jgi:hypothetical protein